MRKALSLVTLTGALAIAAPAAAEPTHRFHGSVCQPVNASRDRIDYAALGATNTNTSSTATVECPITLPRQNGFINSISIGVYDRHTSQNISCTVQPVSLLGDPIHTVTRTSTGSSASQQFLTFDFTTENFFAWMWRARCTIPIKVGSTGSWITAIDVDSE